MMEECTQHEQADGVEASRRSEVAALLADRASGSLGAQLSKAIARTSTRSRRHRGGGFLYGAAVEAITGRPPSDAFRHSMRKSHEAASIQRAWSSGHVWCTLNSHRGVDRIQPDRRWSVGLNWPRRCPKRYGRVGGVLWEPSAQTRALGGAANWMQRDALIMTAADGKGCGREPGARKRRATFAALTTAPYNPRPRQAGKDRRGFPSSRRWCRCSRRISTAEMPVSRPAAQQRSSSHGGDWPPGRRRRRC